MKTIILAAVLFASLKGHAKATATLLNDIKPYRCTVYSTYANSTNPPGQLAEPVKATVPAASAEAALQAFLSTILKASYFRNTSFLAYTLKDELFLVSDADCRL
jgi:hypothetical protein